MAYLSYPDPYRKPPRARQGLEQNIVKRRTPPPARHSYEGVIPGSPAVEAADQGYFEGVLDGAKSAVQSGYEATVNAARSAGGAAKRAPGYFEGVMDGARGAIESGYEATAGAAQQGWRALTANPEAYQDMMATGQGQRTPPMRGELPGRMERAGDAARRGAGAISEAYRGMMDRFDPYNDPGAYQDDMGAGPQSRKPPRRIPHPGAMERAYGKASGMAGQAYDAAADFTGNLIDELQPAARRMASGVANAARSAAGAVSGSAANAMDLLRGDPPPAPRYLQAPVQDEMPMVPQYVPRQPTPQGGSAPEILADYSQIQNLEAGVRRRSPQGYMPGQPLPRTYDGAGTGDPRGYAGMRATQPAPRYIAEPAAPQQRQGIGPEYMQGYPMPSSPEAMAGRQGTPVDARMQQFQEQYTPQGPALNPYVHGPMSPIPGDMPDYMQPEPQSALDKILGMAGSVLDYIIPGADAQQGSVPVYTPDSFTRQYGGTVKKKSPRR